MSGTEIRRYFATCPKGLEYLLVDELKALGAEGVREALAGVYFEGPIGIAYRACLWSRLASRVLLPIAEFACADEEALYAGVQAIDWSAHLRADGTLAVDASLVQSQLKHARYAEQKTKDAVVDQFRQASGQRPSVDTDQPDLRINLFVKRDRATVSIDLSGDALHRRGWRLEQGAAPIKENLACAVLIRAGWPQRMRDQALFDPLCGSGTLLIEGARMAADIAPGLERDYYGFLGWLGFDAVLWQGLLDEARERALIGRESLSPRFFGSDADRRVIEAARANASVAGVSAFVRFDVRVLEDISEAPAPKGLVVSNPPYDARLAADPGLYRALGALLRGPCRDWAAGFIVADEAPGQAIGLRAEKRYALYNGAIACSLLRFAPVAEQPERAPAQPKELTAGAEMVANRLRKNLKKLSPWLKREGVSCYRAYDADLPEYSAAIDVYTAADSAPVEDRGVWLHVQEYQAPREIPEETTRRRLSELLQAAMAVFELPRARIALKTRAPQTRSTRYQKQDLRGHWLPVEEDGLKLQVNLFDYLDTGLFLDHRPARRLIRQQARGKRVLNLFCYTGVASVHAAAGGAASTTSVDLSTTYLEWAARNLGMNGYTGERHRLIQADVLAWLAQNRERFELIFCDPPTFSNSARAADFDMQRDHARLIRLCMDRLAPGGQLLFSNNYRRFRMDAGIEADFQVEEIGPASVPPDFARDLKIHRAFWIR
ncbi:bifunctional 23S rRNA (guanine(2069)-N(7))-methyltransferase RlmK/23S rRNA (guanine(2445)-N(2))-methyltransferase RlmL [uncultured Aquimonas sp.]|uniref:bifunctional 23S rRNA (guanine(2069)-N(7))-methyltransferase RlmK/23S rRNA (guanine(2445)-N(2))-methyltransferase RlmL n=1 Tax=uncultured Aquimonas sp. TaxID=385483 RepID=UPI000ADC9909|nr:bifunctional 23S rRNA (guanine(2069)-N(7))-methyltransferase RlmK/23S rRNA (guanine(2445)-N(2))-methyltransferase RlmL [uncultured Aquimonas sp.]